MQKTKRAQTTTFKLPNRLILDGTLSYSARRVAAVLYSRRNHLGACCKSLAYLARAAACSVNTVRAAVAELEQRGYLASRRNYTYSTELGRPVYDRYTYYCDVRFLGGYTRIPRSIFRHALPNSSFIVCLYLHCRAGNRKRAYPGLSRIGGDLWMAKSTVCLAIRALGAAGLLYVRACVKADGSFSCNSYFFPCDTRSAEQSAHAAPRPILRIRASVSCASLRQDEPTPGTAPFPCGYCTASSPPLQVGFAGTGSPIFDKQSYDLR